MNLGRYLQELYPLINLIFLTESESHGYEAMVLHASGYLMEPMEKSALSRELEDLRHPEGEKERKRVFAQTFGNFELFVDGKPVNFKYSRTKELVAVLVNNRGAQTTNGEIIANLWEDDGDPEKKASYLSNLRQDLQNTFSKLRLNGIILKQRGSLAIAADRIECDLYDWLEKKQDSKYHYLGDYMNQYSWPEYVHAELDEISYAMEE
jgi:two-component SAPR family response regulator